MKVYRFPFLLCLVGCLLAGCSGGSSGDKTVYESVDTVPMLVMQIQKCSRLYTTEYKIHKIVTHEDVLRLQGKLFSQDFNIPLPLGDRKIAIPMDATVKAYIDLQQFSSANVERDGERLNIILPDPKVELTSSKINQQEIREYVSLARAHFSDREMADYEQQGREAILQSVPDMGIVERAQEDAARVIIPIARQLGFEEQNISVSFRRDFDFTAIRSLLITDKD